VTDKVVITGPGAALDMLGAAGAGTGGASAMAARRVAVVVAGPDAGAVGEAVAALRAAGAEAAGWVGDPSDEAAREMARELFPGAEITGPGA
jgi:hypothetical protein